MMPMNEPNPYDYPCFVLKECIQDGEVVESLRKTFSDLQLAYLWAIGDTGHQFPTENTVPVNNSGERVSDNWTYVDFHTLRDWFEQDNHSGYRIFKHNITEYDYVEYILYYDIPDEEPILPNGQPQQLNNGQPLQINQH